MPSRSHNVCSDIKGFLSNSCTLSQPSSARSPSFLFLPPCSCLGPRFAFFPPICTQHRSVQFSRYYLFCPHLLSACLCSRPRERGSGCEAFVSCSALKRLYRQILLHGSKALDSSNSPDGEVPPPSPPHVLFLFLHGDYDLIQQRVAARRGHYMKADLLRSQFAVLEPPSDEENVLPLDLSRSISDLATEVQEHIVRLKSSI